MSKTSTSFSKTSTSFSKTSTSFSKIIAETKAALLMVKEHPTKFGPALKECGRNIRKMNAALKVTAQTVGEKQHIITCISLMNGFRAMMKALRGVTGAGYKPTHPNRKNYASNRVKWEDQYSAFNSRIRTGIVQNLQHKNVLEFLNDVQQMFRRRTINILKKHDALKVNAAFCGEFVVKKGDEEVFEFKFLNTKNVSIYHHSNLNDWFDVNIRQPITTQLEEFQEKDSGWALTAIIHLGINFNKFTPQLGSSFIELPAVIKKKMACVNVQNDDNACFAWALMSALYPAKHSSNRVSSYQHFSKHLHLKNITMPMSIKQIPRFEGQNNMSINVYVLRNKNRKNISIDPIYLTKDKKPTHINLLLLQAEQEDGTTQRYHYVWIKNLSRLVSSQLSRHKCAKYICDRCLHYFHSEFKLQTHTEDCQNMNNCRVRLPAEGETVHFKNFINKETAPFVVYADLECLLVATSDNKSELQKHVPYSIAYYVKCSYDDTLLFYKSHTGEDCQQWFANEMKQFAEDVETVFLCPLPMEPLSLPQNLEFNSAPNCHICEQAFDIRDIRVRDHCHLTGKYRGPAHENCNLSYQECHVVPVVFHNLSGYDSHFIIKNLAKDFEGRIDLLPVNKERYISFTKHVDENLIKFRFIDSFRFLSMSLEKLAQNLVEFPVLKSQFQNLDLVKLDLLTRKGIFPYDYLDSFEKLNEAKLPCKAAFYNKLTDSDVTQDDYAHADNVYNSFNCQTLGEYADLYLKTDVLLLADVFEQFRASCMKTYSLDPAQYYTLPGFTWDCMLKYTKINLELLSDIDMTMFIEKGIRGGLSQCSKRYSKANNKYLPDFNSDDCSKFLIYNDINNQYGWAMSQYLPYGGFEWVDEINFNNLNFNVPADNPEGYILEVDLDYPESMHNSHRDLQFCPEHRAPPNSREKKLMGTLFGKEKYIIHYRNLQQALENGLKLKKIHRVLKFKQSAWLKSYIDLNTKLRTNAKNAFEKDLFKLMNNAVFGKTMENIRNHSIIKLVTKWEGRYGAEALISKPQFKSSTIFDENLVAIELNKSEVYFNKPIYVGMCILDISKLKIYDFHYTYMKSRFGDNARVCYHDTDSLIYEVECPDLYQVIRDDALEYFDTSDYPDNNIYNIPHVNKKVLGLMKDENAGKVMTEFIGLRSKAYATRVGGKDHDKKAKGVKKHIVKNRITFNNYMECLQEGRETRVDQILISSNKHNVSTILQSKIALSPFDDKRFICNDGITTLPWGHFAIMDAE